MAKGVPAIMSLTIAAEFLHRRIHTPISCPHLNNPQGSAIPGQS
jgi:hypothetical protein